VREADCTGVRELETVPEPLAANTPDALGVAVADAAATERLAVGETVDVAAGVAVAVAAARVCVALGVGVGVGVVVGDGVSVGVADAEPARATEAEPERVGVALGAPALALREGV
jgi:hypothetical protein